MGDLLNIDRILEIPTNICLSSSHGCFGYRVVADSMKPLQEEFQQVVELCGTSDDVPCPQHQGSSPSPDQGSSRALLQGTEAHGVITDADYMDEEQYVEYLSKLQQEEERSVPGGPSVVWNYYHLFPYTNHLSPDIICKTKAKANEEI